jgi:hypothetical protein
MALLLLTFASCAGRLPEVQILSDDVWMRLVSLTPSPGARVSSATLVVAELDYSVNGCPPAICYVVPQFSTVDDTKTTSGTRRDRGTDQHYIAAEVGRIRVVVPLDRKELASDPTIRRPIELWLYFNRRARPDQSSNVLGHIGPIRYDFQKSATN